MVVECRAKLWESSKTARVKPVDRSVVKLVLGSQGLQRGAPMASVVAGAALPATPEITPARVFFANPDTYR